MFNIFKKAKNDIEPNENYTWTWKYANGTSTTQSVVAGNYYTAKTDSSVSLSGTWTLYCNKNDGSASYTVGSASLTRSYSWKANSGGTYTPGASIRASGALVDGTIFTSTYSAWGYTKSVQLPAAPTRTGYTFLYWAASAAGATPHYDPGTWLWGGAPGSGTFYAIWQIDTYTVSYNSGNASSGSAPSSQTKTYGTNLTLQSNSGGLSRSSDSGSTSTSGAITLAYNANGGSGAPSNNTGSSVTISGTYPINYTCNGWATSNGGSKAYDLGGTYTSNSAITLYPSWSSSSGSTTWTAKSASATVSSTVPTRTGYTFKGWSTSSTATSASYASGGTYTESITGSKTVTLYAVWTPITTTVTLNPNGGEGGTTSVSITYGTAVGSYPSITKPTKSGSTFAGYYTATSGGTQYYNSAGNSVRAWDIASSTTTLYAQWTVVSYPITYNVGDSTGGTLPSNQTKTHGTALTLATNSMTKNPTTASGTAGTITFNVNGGSGTTSTSSAAATITYSYTANGWGTSSGKTSPDYASGASYTTNAALNLYPAWSRSSSTSYASVQSPTNVGYKSGYEFIGWSTSSTATTATYAPGDVVPGASSQTYYAVWAVTSGKIYVHVGTPSVSVNYTEPTSVDINKAVNDKFVLKQDENGWYWSII